MWLRFYIVDRTGVSIIASIPHCPTENATFTGKNKDVWLRFYKIQKLECLSSIVFHTAILKMLKKETEIKKCGLVAI